MAPPPRENAALVRRNLTDTVAGGDVDTDDGFIASDVPDYNLVCGDSRGHGTVIETGWQVFSAADVEVDVADVVATNDEVAVRGTVTGTDRESLMALAPTGRSFESVCAWFCRIDDDRIAELRSLPDGLGFVQQLRAVLEGTLNRLRTPPTER